MLSRTIWGAFTTLSAETQPTVRTCPCLGLIQGIRDVAFSLSTPPTLVTRKCGTRSVMDANGVIDVDADPQTLVQTLALLDLKALNTSACNILSTFRCTRNGELFRTTALGVLILNLVVLEMVL
jgi:hypothetical protein